MSEAESLEANKNSYFIPKQSNPSLEVSKQTMSEPTLRSTEEVHTPGLMAPSNNGRIVYGGPTTAVDKQIVGNGIISAIEEANDTVDSLNPSRSNRQSTISEHSAVDSDYGDSDGEGYERQYEDDLQSILHGFMRHDINRPKGDAKRNKTTYLALDIFDNDNGLGDAEFFNKHIRVDKSSNSESFHNKLKHFFILSAAGKPIYSLHGDDEIIMGYMGLITTIVSTFEEKFKDEIKSVDYGDMKIVVMNKYPVIFVAISRITYEILLDDSGRNDTTLEKQLIDLSHYLIAVLSKPTIMKNFNNRMNYDLRKILSPLDLQNLDDICMKLTYGIDFTSEYNSTPDGFEYFLAHLLGSTQSMKISHTVRSKLKSILLSCKRVKVTPPHQDTLSDSLLFFKKEEEIYLGDEVLFAFLISPSGKIICEIRPRQHYLSKSDKQLLISMVMSLSGQDTKKAAEDLWIPLCMPNFNPNGFLHIFVKKFNLEINDTALNVKNMRLILISGNKNCFYQMKEVTDHILRKIEKRSAFKEILVKELINSNTLSILNDIKVPIIKHFIFKSKKYNQYFMSPVENFVKDRGVDGSLQMVYFYSVLKNLKATKVKLKIPQNSNLMGPVSKVYDKKLSYCKWDTKSSSFTGFMLSDDTYEFYCLCDDIVNSKDLIRYSLKIIHWCSKYDRRLFTGDEGIF